MRNLLSRGLVAAGVLAALLTAPAAADESTVDIEGTSAGKVFHGLGAQSSGGTTRLLYDYPEPQRSQILDYLFKPGHGASLQHLKVEIGGDGNASNGAEASYQHQRGVPNFDLGYEWWLMREAKKRNPGIVLSALEWGVPGWVGAGDYWAQDNIDYIVGFLRGARRLGLPIDYVGTVNEPRIIHQRVDWDWVKRLDRAITRNGLRTKLIVGDDPRRGCCPSYLPWDDVEAMAADPELARAVDVIGSHYAGGVVPAPAHQFGKPVWSSEDGPWTDAWNGVVGGSYAPFGTMYNLNYIDGRMTSTVVWNLITSYYDNTVFPNSGLMRAASPWSGHYEVTSPVWVTAHTTQFAQPGWRYVDGASKRLPGGGSVVALRSPSGDDYSAIFETQRTADGSVPTRPQKVRVNVRGLKSSGVVHVWRTTASSSFVRLSDIPVVDGSYEITLSPDAIYSVTTTTGQGKGAAVPPPKQPFPMPYSDDFETDALGQQPRYLAQQGGSYELTPCVGKPGRCVEQTVGEQPLEWFQAYPTTYLGDSSGWADVSVEVKIRHDLEGAAEVWARIGDNGAAGQDIAMPVLPDGYYLSVQKTGRWYLGKTVDGERRQLADGFVELPAGQWHTIGMSLRGNTIRASIDRTDVGGAIDTDNTYTRGRVGIGTGWNRVQFDDFSVNGVSR